jgi:hypothetical protein
LLHSSWANYSSPYSPMSLKVTILPMLQVCFWVPLLVIPSLPCYLYSSSSMNLRVDKKSIRDKFHVWNIFRKTFQVVGSSHVLATMSTKSYLIAKISLAITFPFIWLNYNYNFIIWTLLIVVKDIVGLVSIFTMSIILFSWIWLSFLASKHYSLFLFLTCWSH